MSSTDRRTDGQTDKVNPVYPPPPTSLGGGIIIVSSEPSHFLTDSVNINQQYHYMHYHRHWMEINLQTNFSNYEIKETFLKFDKARGEFPVIHSLVQNLVIIGSSSGLALNRWQVIARTNADSVSGAKPGYTG